MGFRYHTRQVAERLKLVGWVRNRSDGTVEAEAEGDNKSVQDLLAWLADGPAGASVRDIRVTEVDPTGGPGFEVRF